jgi:hypothetical protein
VASPYDRAPVSVVVGELHHLALFLVADSRADGASASLLPPLVLKSLESTYG